MPQAVVARDLHKLFANRKSLAASEKAFFEIHVAPVQIPYAVQHVTCVQRVLFSARLLKRKAGAKISEHKQIKFAL